MSFYRDQVFPRILDKVCGQKANREARARVCAGLSGDVVEVGFGTGLNTPYYPPQVTKVFAVEPSRVSLQIAEPRIARSAVPVEFAGLTGERLDLASESFDSVLSTWTLCSIPDVSAALAEMLRVLKPGGGFHFVEHGHAPDANVVRWQERIEPMWRPLACGCHLTRRISETVEHAEFRIEQLDTYYFNGAPKPFGYTFEGRAVKLEDPQVEASKGS